MKVEIPPPLKRSLTPNEKRVLELLTEGKAPPEITKIMRISAAEAIMSIRQKGYEIPTKKENIDMGRNKTPTEKIAEAKRLYAEGCNTYQIAEALEISQSTVSRILSKPKFQLEPAETEQVDSSAQADNSTPEQAEPDTSELPEEHPSEDPLSDPEHTTPPLTVNAEAVSEAWKRYEKETAPKSEPHDTDADTLPSPDKADVKEVTPEIVLEALTDKLTDISLMIGRTEKDLDELNQQIANKKFELGDFNEEYRELRDYIVKLGFRDLLVGIESRRRSAE